MLTGRVLIKGKKKKGKKGWNIAVLIHSPRISLLAAPDS